VQIRVVDLERRAVRPYSSHAATIRSILPLSQAVFASGAEDGTVRCYDFRTRESSDDSSQSSSRSLLGEQMPQPVNASLQMMSNLFKDLGVRVRLLPWSVFLFATEHFFRPAVL
jgi:WD40 repeat protein